MKTRTWIILVASAAAVLAVLSLLPFTARKTGTVAVITQDGEVLREIDLSRVTEEYRFTVTAPDGGVNEILVQPGRICVAQADCPDHVCVRQGWLSDGALPIVCLPHRLVISIRDASGAAPDATAR